MIGGMAANIQDCCFNSMHEKTPRVKRNYRVCGLCNEPFLFDSSRSLFCGRELCTAVRMAHQKYMESQAEQRGMAVA